MTSTVEKCSKVVKGITSTVRSHMDAFDRAREIYLTQIRKAEGEYFTRIKEATAAITEPDEVIVPPAPAAEPASAPATEPAAAAA